MARWLKLGVC